MELNTNLGMESAVFIDKAHMTSVYNLENISNLAETAFYHFMHYEEEIIYFLEQKKNVVGVISIGDLERFYEKQMEKIEVNRRYTALHSIDYSMAQKFFKQAYPVNEVPIISKNNELLGIIRYEKTSQIRREQRKNLKDAKMGKSRWMKREISRFINQTRAQVVIYSMCESLLNQKDIEILRRRRSNMENMKWKGLSEKEWKTFWQSEYEDGIVEIMRMEQRQISLVIKNGVASFTNKRGKCYSFEDGNRLTANVPYDANRRIFMYGSCIIAGAYCKDEQTIAWYLQKKLNEEGYISWRVINKGLFGTEYFYNAMFVEKLSEDDVVIIYCPERWLPDQGMDKIVLRGELADTYREIPSLTDHIADTTLHCNYVVNQKLAGRIYEDLCSSGLLDSEKKTGRSEKIQDYYIGWDIWEYFGNYFEQYHLHKEEGDVKSGAIVMNCNPFTRGHRYLIEQALKIVDNLYIFVVEEDQSYFSFQDRLYMVEQGVRDLTGVRVVPSGKYIISLETFAQYFEKDQVQTIDSMDYDIYIFGEVVAAELGIKYRFVGEEPFDQVTRAYNETMKRILPHFGVEVIEFPRKSLSDNEEIISASLVRKAIKEKDMKMVKRLCMDSTYKFLKDEVMKD